MLELGLGRGLQLGDDVLRELLAKLNTPLVEGVDAPDGSLSEDAVLVEGDQNTEGVRVELVGMLILTVPVSTRPVSKRPR